MASMSARKSSHGTFFLIVSSGSPLAPIASSLRSTSKKPFCPMTRSLHRPYPRAVTESDSRALGERNFSRHARREVHPMLAALVAATPLPFLQTIVDVVPARTVFGRVCLLGDAAFVVRPHTAGATAKAARDDRVDFSSL